MINVLKRFYNKFKPLSAEDRVIQYLSESVDMYDLERRQRELMRRSGGSF